MIEIALLFGGVLSLVTTARLVAIYTSELFSSAEELLSSEIELSKRRQRFLAEIEHHPHDLLLISRLYGSFCTIGSTVLTILFGARLAALVGLPQLPTIAISVAGGWLVFVLLVEVMPPTGGSESLQKVLPGRLWLVALLYRIFSPLRRVAGSFRARYAVDRRDEEKKEEIVERAIETLAEGIGAEEPIIEEDERQMIQQIFRLDTTEVKEVMVPRINIVAVHEQTSLEELRTLVRQKGHSRYPVYGEDIDDIKGIIYAKDVFCSEPMTAADFKIEKLLRVPHFVPETQVIDKLLDEFRRKHIHLAIVVDEYGGTAGLVCLEDIIEEIIGEIEDEHDYAAPSIVIGPDGSIIVAGQVSLEEITGHFDLKPFSEEFETVGGLIYDLVGGVPPEGKVLTRGPLRLTVIKMDGQRIAEIKVELLPEEDDE